MVLICNVDELGEYGLLEACIPCVVKVYVKKALLKAGLFGDIKLMFSCLF